MLYYIYCISKTSLTLSLFIEAPHAKPGKSAVMYIRVRGIKFVSFYDFSLELGTVPSVVFQELFRVLYFRNCFECCNLGTVPSVVLFVFFYFIVVILLIEKETVLLCLADSSVCFFCICYLFLQRSSQARINMGLDYSITRYAAFYVNEILLLKVLPSSDLQ